MGFRRLIELSDKTAKEMLSDYYVVSVSKMNNLIECLEKGAEQIKKLTAENKRFQEREGNAKFYLCCPTSDNPFRQDRLKIVDFGVSDNIYIVERAKDSE